LKFVDQDGGVAFLVFLQHVRALVEQEHGLHEQVVEVHGVVGLQQRLVVGVDAARDFGDVVGGGVLVGGDELVFGAADAVEQLIGREFFVVQVELFEDLLDGLKLVGRIEDDEVTAVVGQVVAFAAQDARAGGVEGAHGEAAQVAAEQRFDAVAHFAGGFVGEGDGHDAPGGKAQRLDQVDDAVGEHARFAAARPGEHQHGAGGGRDGRYLSVVESVE
jgi:hypothetical protein